MRLLEIFSALTFLDTIPSDCGQTLVMADLQDYSDPEKMSVYSKINVFVSALHTYNLELAVRTKDMVVLDLPCGDGNYVRKFFRDGATKVIASDIVPYQIEVAKTKDREAGIPEGFVEYYVHDARVPKKFSSTLADVCYSVHLFCFAEDYTQLRAMARTINMNVKPGALCAVIICSVGSSDSDFCKALSSHEEKVVHLDRPSTDNTTPRKIHTVSKGFHLIRYAWLCSTVCAALKEEGFSIVSDAPYKFESNTENPEFVEWYVRVTDRKMITAKKLN